MREAYVILGLCFMIVSLIFVFLLKVDPLPYFIIALIGFVAFSIYAFYLDGVIEQKNDRILDLIDENSKLESKIIDGDYEK